MHYSKMFLPTLREAPADAEVMSHQLMFRAGMIRKIASGIYTWMPFGLRALRKVEGIIREQMNRAGAQELLMPGVQPAELWEESGRWNAYGKELLRMKDRHDREFCLGPTHEEVITDLVRNEVRSYRDLPQNLYQIQMKFRDEIRPRFGVMRSREFGMKDAYSFDAEDAGADKSYQAMFDAYTRIFELCGLKFMAVEAMTGQIGGSFSHEFMVLADTGEDEVVVCDQGDYAANLEKAETSPEDQDGSEEPEASLEKVHTPGKHTVEEVCEFLGLSPKQLAKTLLFDSDKGPLVALVRGDRELNQAKLMSATGAAWVTLATAQSIEEYTGGPQGFSGPKGLELPIWADDEVARMKNFIIGANEKDYHYTGANSGRDFNITQTADLKTAREGDQCPKCRGRLGITRGIEVGHVFKLGTKYSEALGANYLDAEGRECPIIMGCYGIGTGRTVASAIEQNHDERGIIWPMPIAPFQVYLMVINAKDQASKDATDKLYEQLQAAGVDVLFDDRDERAGVKFKDADLLGIPIRVVIGSKTLAKGAVELKLRQDEKPDLVPIEKAVERIEEIIAEQSTF